MKLSGQAYSMQHFDILNVDIFKDLIFKIIKVAVIDGSDAATIMITFLKKEWFKDSIGK